MTAHSFAGAAVPAGVWIDEVSAQLQARWPSIDPARLDDVASDLWQDDTLRVLEPRVAARLWLEPVGSGAASGGSELRR